MRWEGQQVPVPFVTAWTSEKGWEARRDPLVGAVAWFASEGAPGEGRPNVSKMDPARCRSSVIRVRCQVCGVVLGRRKSRYAVGVYNAKPDPRGRPVLEHPWCCRSCLRDSFRWCPALRRAQPEVFRVRRHEVVHTLTMDPGLPAPTDPGERARAFKAVGYSRIVLVDASVVPVASL